MILRNESPRRTPHTEACVFLFDYKSRGEIPLWLGMTGDYVEFTNMDSPSVETGQYPVSTIANIRIFVYS